MLGAASDNTDPQPKKGSGSGGASAAPGSSGSLPATGPDAGQAPGQERNLKKVELDLEGAPFLEEEPPAAPKPEAAPTPTAKPAAGKDAAGAKKSKKKLIIIGGLALLLLGAAAGSYFMFFAAPKIEPVVVTVPSSPILDPAPVDGFNISLKPLWVELEDPAGEMRVLICTLLIPTNNEENVLELNAKTILVRDAIYYYLRNKDYAFLADSAKLEEIKKDITNIINDYLMTEKIKEVLFEDYIIR
jgi:flagellar FliL protein